MVSEIRCWNQEILSQSVVEGLRSIPPDQLLIVTDAHWTLFTGGERASSHLVGLLEHIHDTTKGGLVVVSGGTIAELDKDLFPSVLPVIGGRCVEQRFDRAGQVRYQHERLFSPGFTESLERLQDEFGGDIMVECVPPGKQPGSIYLSIDPAVRTDCEKRRQLLQVMDEFIATLPGADEVSITPGFSTRYLTYGQPSKARALQALLSHEKFENRIVVAFGDDPAKDGPLLSGAIERGGYGFLVNGRHTGDGLPGDVLTLESPAALTALLCQVFDYPEPGERHGPMAASSGALRDMLGQFRDPGVGVAPKFA